MNSIFQELPKKASTFKDILVKIMVNSFYIYSHARMKIFNDCVKSVNFSDILNHAAIVVYSIGKSSYRHISTLSNFSKVFQKLV